MNRCPDFKTSHHGHDRNPLKDLFYTRAQSEVKSVKYADMNTLKQIKMLNIQAFCAHVGHVRTCGSEEI